MGLRPAAAPIPSLSSPPERPQLPRPLASPRLNPPWPLGWYKTGKLCVPSLLWGLGGKGSRSCEQSGERRPLSENIELPPGCWARVPALLAPAEIQIASGGGSQLSTSVKMTPAGTGPSSPERRLCQGAGRPPGEAPRRGAESDHTGHPKALAAGLASIPRAGRRPPDFSSPPRDPVRAGVLGPVPGRAPGTKAAGDRGAWGQEGGRTGSVARGLCAGTEGQGTRKALTAGSWDPEQQGRGCRPCGDPGAGGGQAPAGRAGPGMRATCLPTGLMEHSCRGPGPEVCASRGGGVGAGRYNGRNTHT